MTQTLTQTELGIRRATWDDMEVIASFLRSTAEWYRPFVAEQDMVEHDVPASWKAENFARREFYVGSLEGKPIGTVSLQDFGDYAYVGYVYLDADHVGRGHGRELLEFALGLASRRGKRGLTLIAHPEATWATRAYLKFGFKLHAARREDVLAWNEGALQDYYEEGFQLFVYDLPSREER
tara:strand:+ start:452 stop:991 length:540 start_codon:yes stop_codon:yes gene_type:complete